MKVDTGKFWDKGVPIFGIRFPLGGVVGYSLLACMVIMFVVNIPYERQRTRERAAQAKQMRIELQGRVADWAQNNQLAVTELNQCVGRYEAGSCMLSSDPTKPMMKIVCDPNKCFREW